MLAWGADSGVRDKQGKNALDLCMSPELSLILQQFSRNSLDSVDIPSPIGEVTTYIVNEARESGRDHSDKITLPMRCSLVSPVTEKSSVTCQLFPIYAWLEKIHLEDYYEILVDAGYDDIQVMVQQMNGPMPISDRNLREIGISKPGHRRYLLVNLEQEAGLSGKVILKKHVRERSSGLIQCCVVAHGTRNLFSPPGLMEWLDDINLGNLYGLFVEAGYDSYEFLVDIQNSLHPLTSKQLESEVKIGSHQDRLTILNRLEQDIGYYYQENEPSKIMFDEPRRIVCESCSVF